VTLPPTSTSTCLIFFNSFLSASICSFCFFEVLSVSASSRFNSSNLFPEVVFVPLQSAQQVLHADAPNIGSRSNKLLCSKIKRKTDNQHPFTPKRGVFVDLVLLLASLLQHVESVLSSFVVTQDFLDLGHSYSKTF